MIKVRIDAGSAKIRPGPPLEAAEDLAEPAVAGRVWTGVVPTWTALGEPIPGPENRVGAVPAFVRDHVRDANAWNRDAALAQAETAMPPQRRDAAGREAE